MKRYSLRIIEHFSRPRNTGVMKDAHATVNVKTPVCGDQIVLFARMNGDRIGPCSYLVYGCTATIGIAGILAEELTGKTLADLAAIDADAVAAMAGGLTPTQRHAAELGAEVVRNLAAALPRLGHRLVA